MHFIVAVALASVCATQQALPSDSAVRAMLAPRTGQESGIVVGLLDASGKRVVAVGTGGAGADRLFEIGSITKVFTASVLADMVVRGEVRLDDPVQKFLPRSVRMPERSGRQITLLDLVTQSSGLPRMPANFSPRDSTNPYADYSVQQMYDFLSGYQLPRDIGAEYEYSNLGMGLLGHALALKARMSYEALVKSRILTPLGMRETAISLTPELRARVAPGHDAEGHVVANWDLPTLAGAGALRSTVADMLTFLAANLDSTATSLSRTLATTHSERHATGDSHLKIGMAWHILQRPVGNIVWHNGGTGGYRTFIGFDPVRHVGVVALSNKNDGVDDIGFHLLDETFPLRPAPKLHTEVGVDSLVLQRYVGEYELSPAFHIVISREAAQLYLQATAQPRFALFAESDSTFFLKVVDAQISFERGDLVLHQNGQNIPGKKIH